jgi:hypothetical protein
MSKRSVLITIVAFLSGLPFVMYFFRKSQKMQPASVEPRLPPHTAEADLGTIGHNKLANEIVHNNKMQYDVLEVSPTMFPFPEDLIFLDSVKVSPNGKKVAVAGSALPHCKIYTAPFPPQSASDYVLVADLPRSYRVAPLAWGADSDTLYFLSFGASVNPDDPVIGLYRTTGIPAQPDMVYALKKEKDAGMNFLERYALTGNNDDVFGLFNESKDNTYLIENQKLFRLTDDGKVTLTMDVPQLKSPPSKSVMAIQKSGKELEAVFCCLEATEAKFVPDVGIFDGFYMAVNKLKINLDNRKISLSPFIPPLEHTYSGVLNGQYLASAATSFHDCFRLIIADKDKPYQRKELQFKSAGDGQHWLSDCLDITADGKWAVCKIHLFENGRHSREHLLDFQTVKKPEYQLLLVPVNK